MFDIAWSEMVLIGAVALVVIGPKDLPKVLRTVGQTVGKVRRMAAEFQGQFNEAMREAELADLKKQVEDVGGSVSSALETSPTPSTDYKPIEEPKDFSALAGTGDVAKPDAAALKEAEAKLAALPVPEPPPVDVAGQAPAAKPKRARKPKAEPAGSTGEAPAVEVTAVNEAPAKPVRARKPKAEPVAPAEEAPAANVATADEASAKPARARRSKTAVIEVAAAAQDEAAAPAKTARKRKPKAAVKGEGSSA
ncbi:Sec-independent protein translocase protein TatB [Bosea sp. AS-1]|uniref:Sec-independent protein translocase protein TatB n=1 Tax=Bosea sp. AS-1 TaxID=2015316 RepID=UPI000B770CBF|nr:Sec-independent protein translocase protein TatB [Bosea sp. AS-1]